MNVSLTDELKRWIDERVASGLYRSSSEVVREAIRVLREREELKELRRAELRRLLRTADADVTAGRVMPFDDDLIEDIKDEGRRILAAKD